MSLQPPERPESGHDVLPVVADENGKWNWVFLGPDPIALPVAGRGSGSADEMRQCLMDSDFPVLFGLLRMRFGAGHFSRTEYIFVVGTLSDSPKKAKPLAIGHAMATRAAMEKQVATFRQWCCTVEATCLGDLSLENVIATVRRAVVIDDSLCQGMFSVSGSRAALGDEVGRLQLAPAKVEAVPLVSVPQRARATEGAPEALNPTTPIAIKKAVFASSPTSSLRRQQFQMTPQRTSPELTQPLQLSSHRGSPRLQETSGVFVFGEQPLPYSPQVQPIARLHDLFSGSYGGQPMSPAHPSQTRVADQQLPDPQVLAPATLPCKLWSSFKEDSAERERQPRCVAAGTSLPPQRRKPMVQSQDIVDGNSSQSPAVARPVVAPWIPSPQFTAEVSSLKRFGPLGGTCQASCAESASGTISQLSPPGCQASPAPKSSQFSLAKTLGSIQSSLCEDLAALEADLPPQSQPKPLESSEASPYASPLENVQFQPRSTTPPGTIGPALELPRASCPPSTAPYSSWSGRSGSPCNSHSLRPDELLKQSCEPGPAQPSNGHIPNEQSGQHQQGTSEQEPWPALLTRRALPLDVASDTPCLLTLRAEPLPSVSNAASGRAACSPSIPCIPGFPCEASTSIVAPLQLRTQNAQHTHLLPGTRAPCASNPAALTLGRAVIKQPSSGSLSSSAPSASGAESMRLKQLGSVPSGLLSWDPPPLASPELWRHSTSHMLGPHLHPGSLSSPARQAQELRSGSPSPAVTPRPPAGTSTNPPLLTQMLRSRSPSPAVTPRTPVGRPSNPLFKTAEVRCRSTSPALTPRLPAGTPSSLPSQTQQRWPLSSSPVQTWCSPPGRPSSAHLQATQRRSRSWSPVHCSRLPPGSPGKPPFQAREVRSRSSSPLPTPQWQPDTPTSQLCQLQTRIELPQQATVALGADRIGIDIGHASPRGVGWRSCEQTRISRSNSPVEQRVFRRERVEQYCKFRNGRYVSHAEIMAALEAREPVTPATPLVAGPNGKMVPGIPLTYGAPKLSWPGRRGPVSWSEVSSPSQPRSPRSPSPGAAAGRQAHMER